MLKRFVLKLAGMGDPGSARTRAVVRFKRWLLGSDQALYRRYAASTPVARLHIGGGPRLLEGWLNTDLESSSGVMAMDATRAFPFADGSFAFLFSEHMIEHVPYEGGVSMVQECYRVLQPGGVIRLVTPDLKALASLYASPLGEIEKGYLDWFCAELLCPDRLITPAQVLNAHFRLWGHQFLYDEETLRDLLANAGFHDIRRCDLMQSEHPELLGLENTSRYPEGFLAFESLALEARK